MPAYSDPNYMTKTSGISELGTQELKPKGTVSPKDPGTNPRGGSENEPVRINPGVGLADASSQAHDTARKMGWGYQDAYGGQGAPTGGQNLDARGQYTIKLPRGSSL